MTENKPVDTSKASRLANMLEGLDFPADKPKILLYIKEKFPAQNQDNDIIQKLQNNLTDNKRFENVYEIEKQAGLIIKD